MMRASDMDRADIEQDRDRGDTTRSTLEGLRNQTEYVLRMMRCADLALHAEDADDNLDCAAVQTVADLACYYLMGVVEEMNAVLKRPDDRPLKLRH